jgi:uncharacterized membrane protein YccC
MSRRAKASARGRPASPETTSQKPPTPDDNALAPWHLFVLGGLAAATAAVVLVRGSGPENVILISLAIGTASLTGIAAFRTLAPLALSELGERVEMVGGRTRTALEREKMLVLRAIKELEFDRAMRKVSDADFQEMMGRLRARAARLMKQLDGGAAEYTELIERELSARIGRTPRPVKSVADRATPAEPEVSAAIPEEPVSVPDADRRCAQCGTANDPDARFCKECGTKIGATA